MSIMDDLDEFTESDGGDIRARCMHCGDRFETPAEIRLHQNRCRPKHWFWFYNNNPIEFAALALCVGLFFGHFIPSLFSIMMISLAINYWVMHRTRKRLGRELGIRNSGS